MGVTGLWDIIAPSGKSRSLTHLTVVDGFEKNTSQKRAYRVGIDASIWFKHAQWSKEGENPQLRMLFFRLVQIARLPILPLFVLDGRSRPKMKRGSKLGKSGTHPLAKDFKILLDAFGMEWREAAGEAEAELAFLNRIGAVDAIMTDDADAFLFGARVIIRNISQSLTGNKALPALNSDGKASKAHVMVFNDEEIRRNPQVFLTQGGMILFALLTGGDYDKGVDNVGKQTAHALAKCGFGDELLEATKSPDIQILKRFLPGWRQRMNEELRENKSGFLQRCRHNLTIPDTFPELGLLKKYVEPVLRTGGASIRGTGGMNLPKIATLCEKYFEWGTRTMIIKRFRSLMWDACIIHILRRAAMEQDRKESEALFSRGILDNRLTGATRPGVLDDVGTSITLMTRYLTANDIDRRSEAFVNRSVSSAPTQDHKSFVLGICSKRQHVSTDKLLEYRLEIDPIALVQLTNSGIKGTRPDTTVSPNQNENWEHDDLDEDMDANNKQKAKRPVSPSEPIRIWCPAGMLECVNPSLVREYEEKLEAKATGGSCRGINVVDRETNPTTGRKRRAERKTRRVEDVVESAEDHQPSRSQKRQSDRERVSVPVKQIARDVGTGSRARTDQPTQIITKPSVKHENVKEEESASPMLPPTRTPGFLFRIEDPCNPDLIDRDDLRSGSDNLQSNGRFSLDNLKSPTLRSKIPGITFENHDFDYSDDALDIAHERKFARIAQSLSNDHPRHLVNRGSVKAVPAKRRVTRAKPDDQRRRETKRLLSGTTSHPDPSKQYSRLGTNLDKEKTEKPPSSQRSYYSERPLPPATSRSSRATPLFHGVLDLDSSDEDMDEKQLSTRSLARSESYTSSQSSWSTLLPPSSSQASSSSLNDFEFT